MKENMSQARADAKQHLIVAMERLSGTYRDETLWRHLRSLEEALDADPIEKELSDLHTWLCDQADEYERKGSTLTAEAYLIVAQEVLRRIG